MGTTGLGLYPVSFDETGVKASSVPLTRTATYCEVCFWKCAAWAYTDDKGDVVKLIGNEIDPHCYGRLCPRGTGGVGCTATTTD